MPNVMLRMRRLTADADYDVSEMSGNVASSWSDYEKYHAYYELRTKRIHLGLPDNMTKLQKQGVFLFCWAPFFSVNIIQAFCIRFPGEITANSATQVEGFCNISPTAISLCVWLGYKIF
ncbi:unnamed protein product [Protopolystoma xenopodis]|uniref:Uncharacterized protein n=1 Tax=Protopolystoma xenopodis TaxID=117903 RepID=A0A448XMX2_9PLAT|nr:unnamed protein product [Protopolystoma xenopodis]